MQQIGIDDPQWLTTLPQVVAPREDEWLGGILLRCDAANGWASRTTVTHLMRVVKKRMREAWRSDLPNLIVWGKTAGYLQRLAQLLALSPHQIRATTYTDELARLFGLPKVNATLLTLTFVFQLCPECIAEERLLRRVLVLPYVTVCPNHHLESVAEILSRKSQPPTCGMIRVPKPNHVHREAVWSAFYHQPRAPARPICPTSHHLSTISSSAFSPPS